MSSGKLFQAAKKLAPGALLGRSKAAQPISYQRQRRRRARRGCQGVSQAFVYLGASEGSDSYEEFEVPHGVTQLIVELWGGEGARGEGSSAGLGGLGGYVKAVIPVVPGETLRVYVGGNGGPQPTSPAQRAPGYNGGGNGGSWTSDGGGGGGGTDIRRSPYGLADRLVVAPGGAGGGSASIPQASGHGGDGRFYVGENGVAGSFGTPGFGATQSAGGAQSPDGNSCFNGTPAQPGTFGDGGNGDDGPSCLGRGGGGGGGGWYGGGGGGHSSGGGGGSGWVIPAGTVLEVIDGTRTGSGYANLYWDCAGLDTDLSDRLILWLHGADAPDGSADGTNLDLWTDRSNYSNDIGATGSARPKITRTIGGVTVVDFDGVDDVMSGTLQTIAEHLDGSGETAITVYMAGIVDALPANVIWLSFNSGAYFSQWRSGAFRQIRISGDVTLDTGVGSGYPPIGSLFHMRGLFTGAGGVGEPASSIAINGTIDASTSWLGRQNPFGTFSLGGSGGVFSNMAVAELRVYDTFITPGSDEDIAIRAEMEANWGNAFPGNISGLRLWLKSQDETSIRAASSPFWEDRSGLANNFEINGTQPSTGTRQVNSKNVLDIAGSMGVANSGFTLAQPLSIYMVFTLDDLTIQSRVIATGGGTVFIVSHEPSAGYLQLQLGAGPIVQSPAGSIPSAGTYYARVIANGASSTVRLGSLTGVAANPGATGISPSISFPDLSASANMALHEYLFFNRVLGTAEDAAVEAYIRGEWNV